MTVVIDWQELIARRNVWVEHNFPEMKWGNNAPYESLLGVQEELGEFTHAFLKQGQNVRTNEDHDANMRDAIADCTIYLLGVMAFYDVQPGGGWPASPRMSEVDTVLWWGECTGRLFGIVRNGVGFQMVADAITELTLTMHRLCELRAWDYDAIVLETWAKVEQRDWVAYPETGLPPAIKSPLQQAVDEARGGPKPPPPIQGYA